MLRVRSLSPTRVLLVGSSRPSTLRSLHCLRASEPLKVLFFGGDEFSCIVLNQLHRSRDVWKELSIVTQPDRRIGRRASQLAISPLKSWSEDVGLPVYCIPHEKVSFRTWKPPPPFDRCSNDSNAVLISASFGRIIHDSLLHVFPPSRRLNVHPSLLPLYRGPAPIQHTIADGCKETGVCVIEMREKVHGVDSGEIWAKAVTPIAPRSTFVELRDQLAKKGGELLVSVLRDIMNGNAIATPQDHSNASRAPFITQCTAALDFHSWDAAKVDRMHRAISYQRPLTTTLPSSKLLRLLDLQPLDLSSTSISSSISQTLQTPGDTTYDAHQKSLIVRCAGETYITVQTVHQQDRNAVHAKEWWNGVRPEWIRSGVLRLGGSNGEN